MLWWFMQNETLRIYAIARNRFEWRSWRTFKTFATDPLDTALMAAIIDADMSVIDVTDRLADVNTTPVDRQQTAGRQAAIVR